ncbi:MAG: 50S ribosomal protein L21 [Pseudomonadota bacterium]
MYAIVQTGGKQYKVQPGDQVRVEKIDGEPGSLVELDRVLAVAGDEAIDLGSPLIQDARVKATILKTARNRKIVVFKKKRRQGYHKKQGHRQWFTLLRIDEIARLGQVVEMDAPEQTSPDHSPEE